MVREICMAKRKNIVVMIVTRIVFSGCSVFISIFIFNSEGKKTEILENNWSGKKIVHSFESFGTIFFLLH